MNKNKVFKCPECGLYNKTSAIRCSCGRVFRKDDYDGNVLIMPSEKRPCASCYSIVPVSEQIEIDGNQYCMKCANNIRKKEKIEKIEKIIITTTNHIDGHKVSKYIGIESVEIVLGTGVFSEITSFVGDIFGMRSSAFEEKLQNAKQLAFNKLRMKAFEIGGNAIIGIDVDYTEFMDNRIGLIVNGTVVIIEQIARIEEKQENI